jgi:hypothetical protein
MPCTEQGSKALLPLPSHETGQLQDVIGHRETRRKKTNVTKMVMAMSTVIIPQKSTSQVKVKDIVVVYIVL